MLHGQDFRLQDFRLQDFRSPTFFRHTREGGYPLFSISDWIPAYAGMTKSESPTFFRHTREGGYLDSRIRGSESPGNIGIINAKKSDHQWLSYFH